MPYSTKSAASSRKATRDDERRHIKLLVTRLLISAIATRRASSLPPTRAVRHTRRAHAKPLVAFITTSRAFIYRRKLIMPPFCITWASITALQERHTQSAGCRMLESDFRRQISGHQMPGARFSLCHARGFSPTYGSRGDTSPATSTNSCNSRQITQPRTSTTAMPSAFI